jgi:hypothetical protein
MKIQMHNSELCGNLYATIYIDSEKRMRHLFHLILFALSICIVRSASAQMVSGADMPGFNETFGLGLLQKSKDLEVIQIGCSAGPNILQPGDKLVFTFRFTNKTDQEIKAPGHVEVIRYETSVPSGDIWTPHVRKIALEGAAPVNIDIPAKGTQDLTLASPVKTGPYGGLGLVFDFGKEGRLFGAAIARVMKPDEGRIRLPVLTLDMPWPFQMSDKVTQLFKKLGIKGCRMGASYTPTTSPNLESDLAELGKFLKWCQENDIAVMLTVGAGSAPQPLGRGRPWLNDDNSMKQGVKEDLAWLPSYDSDFEKWVKLVCTRWGWPKGPVNALELWNEPWEGVSISGWGADMIRYRDLYERMAKGVMEARADAGVKVLIGGACSSSNTLDKFFADGSEKFLPILDFCSIHYQEMSAIPSIIPSWMDRKGPYGRVQVWDTESWVANSEDRYAAVMASMRAQGQDRAMGIYGGNVYDPQNFDLNGKHYSAVQAWAPAAAVAAGAKFLGQRPFKEILFKNGLPWVFLFQSADKPDDGTAVVVGDLGGVYDRNKLLFRTVLGLKNAPFVAAIKKKMETASAAELKTLQTELSAAEVLQGGSYTLASGPYSLYDFYGNKTAPKNGKIIVPLNGLGYFLRPDGSPGSFAKLTEALRHGRIEGYQPVEVIFHDMLSGIESHPAIRLTLTNILNRTIHGKLTARMKGMELGNSETSITLTPNETRDIYIKVLQGREAESNLYPMEISFDAGKDGSVTRREDIRVNDIVRRTIDVDGSLEDWKGIVPQPVTGSAIGASMTELAWLPFKSFGNNVVNGAAAGYLAYDDKYFYFAAKIADNTPYAGNIRFANRDDDSYFYPKEVTDQGKTLVWPDGVRQFSYRRDPDLPSGSGTDNVQIAFNVLPENQKPWMEYPHGTMPHFMAYWDTDYEFALNLVSPKYGGGTEIWKLNAPGIPRKHFYPRQPHAPIDGGPVLDGKLAIRHTATERIVECAIPWSEIPIVHQRMLAGKPIKFSFRVNDDDGSAYELAQNRSISKVNFPAFHNDWETHWANELQFSFQK